VGIDAATGGWPGVKQIRTQDRSGDFFLVAVLVANFAWGILLLLLLRAEGSTDIHPREVLALFFLFNAATLFFFRKAFLRPPLDALERVSEALAEEGELLPERAAPRQVANAVKSRLVRFRKDVEEERLGLEGKYARQVEDLGQAHKDLVAHHKLTKKMLQSRQVEEVFDTLMEGIADGYGFRGALLGKVSRDGFLVFAGEPDPLSGMPTQIPLWNPRSLLARIFWGGASAFLPSPPELQHLPEEETILGGGAAYLVPVTRTLKTRCAEVKNCGDRACVNFYSENLKCWLRKVPAGSFTPDADPDLFREPLEECLRCEVFPSAAILVLRTVPNGKGITRESVMPVSSIASEATLALEVVSLYDNMKLMAITDGLTGLFNHREFYNALRRELERGRRYRHNLSLLMIDVDDFKQFNDRFGHPAGDFALRKIADLLRGCARTTDIIARYGGEEFALILPESQPVGALMVAERIKTEIAAHNFIPNANISVHLTVSIGVYSCNDGSSSEDQMVSLADEAAYTAKQQGKNRVVVKATR
jgi:diguanylate cyclase (GGDEF)-like protein